MTGAIIQIYAKNSANDFLITGNPDINVFKSIFDKSNNFVSDIHENFPINEVKYNSKITFDIPRTSDYLNKIILKIKFPILEIPNDSSYIKWTNSIGHALIEKIELLIGDYIVTESDGLLHEILSELNNESTQTGYNNMIGKYISNTLIPNADTKECVYYIPLKFWFNKGLANSIPVYNLHKHSIKINIYTRRFEDIILYDGNDIPVQKELVSLSLLCENIYIESTQLNYLKLNSKNNDFAITQVQRLIDTEILNSNEIKSIKLDKFNLPVKCLYIVFRELDSINNNDYFNFCKRTTLSNEQPVPLVRTIKFLVEGNEFYKEEDESYYRFVTHYIYNTENMSDKYIYMLPFSKNEKDCNIYLGSLNFSAIDNSNLIVKMNNGINPCNVSIYAINYNSINISKDSVGIKFLS